MIEKRAGSNKIARIRRFSSPIRIYHSMRKPLGNILKIYYGPFAMYLESYISATVPPRGSLSSCISVRIPTGALCVCASRITISASRLGLFFLFLSRLSSSHEYRYLHSRLGKASEWTAVVGYCVGGGPPYVSPAIPATFGKGITFVVR